MTFIEKTYWSAESSKINEIQGLNSVGSSEEMIRLDFPPVSSRSLLSTKDQALILPLAIEASCFSN